MICEEIGEIPKREFETLFWPRRQNRSGANRSLAPGLHKQEQTSRPVDSLHESWNWLHKQRDNRTWMFSLCDRQTTDDETFETFENSEPSINGPFEQLEQDEELWSIWENNNSKVDMIRCTSSLNLFQAKSMKVNHDLKTILHKEVNHENSRWSIWDESAPAYLIRCVTILNLFHMKLREVPCNLKNTMRKTFKHDIEGDPEVRAVKAKLPNMRYFLNFLF
jgi:hypothetical protein